LPVPVALRWSSHTPQRLRGHPRPCTLLSRMSPDRHRLRACRGPVRRCRSRRGFPTKKAPPALSGGPESVERRLQGRRGLLPAAPMCYGYANHGGMLLMTKRAGDLGPQKQARQPYFFALPLTFRTASRPPLPCLSREGGRSSKSRPRAHHHTLPPSHREDKSWFIRRQPMG
jgi:hypothetical protein